MNEAAAHCEQRPRQSVLGRDWLRAVFNVERLQNRGRGSLNTIQRSCQRCRISPIQLNVVTSGFGRFQADRLSDDERNGFRLEFTRVSRFRTVTRTVEQLVRELVRQHRELGSRGQAVQYSDTTATRQAERPSQVVAVLDADAVRGNRTFESGCVLAGRVVFEDGVTPHPVWPDGADPRERAEAEAALASADGAEP